MSIAGLLPSSADEESGESDNEGGKENTQLVS